MEWDVRPIILNFDRFCQVVFAVQSLILYIIEAPLMIGSFTVYFYQMMPLITLSPKWEHRTSKIENQESHHYVFTDRNTARGVYAKYYPISKYKGLPLLIVTVTSAQKLIFGNNYHNSTNIKLIIEKSNEQVHKVPCLDTIDVGEGLLRRVDF